jgi:hypothetical protein
VRTAAPSQPLAVNATHAEPHARACRTHLSHAERHADREEGDSHPAARRGVAHCVRQLERRRFPHVERAGVPHQPHTATAGPPKDRAVTRPEMPPHSGVSIVMPHTALVAFCS